MILELIETPCPGCDKMMKASEPLPSCNECECCFCSDACREASNRGIVHDYAKPLEE